MTVTASPDYQEVARINDPDGITVIITQRQSTGALSFMICKEFDRNGQVERTSYLARRHLPALHRVLPLIEDELDAHVERARAREQGTL